ncbi:hypothetical protein L210DRAFT_3499385 [Boletus edulis BED1]|uniref:Uncharacterized protein n=1 Tax=Boletus edulis BED1 TaxID=1328754 RepID=A0AAD4GM68_BOLED|nr:hypothetical protein L210DRAFT_3499385 [Boletus edulis BED1]
MPHPMILLSRGPRENPREELKLNQHAFEAQSPYQALIQAATRAPFVSFNTEIIAAQEVLNLRSVGKWRSPTRLLHSAERYSHLTPIAPRSGRGLEQTCSYLSTRYKQLETMEKFDMAIVLAWKTLRPVQFFELLVVYLSTRCNALGQWRTSTGPLYSIEKHFCAHQDTTSQATLQMNFILGISSSAQWRDPNEAIVLVSRSTRPPPTGDPVALNVFEQCRYPSDPSV